MLDRHIQKSDKYAFKLAEFLKLDCLRPQLLQLLQELLPETGLVPGSDALQVCADEIVELYGTNAHQVQKQC